MPRIQGPLSLQLPVVSFLPGKGRILAFLTLPPSTFAEAKSWGSLDEKWGFPLLPSSHSWSRVYSTLRILGCSAPLLLRWRFHARTDKLRTSGCCSIFTKCWASTTGISLREQLAIDPTCKSRALGFNLFPKELTSFVPLEKFNPKDTSGTEVVVMKSHWEEI